MNENTNKKINELITSNDVCLFMKGTPDVPQCGFSLAVSNMLKHLEIKFKGVNVLEEIFRESFVIEIAWENKIEYKIDDVLRQENYEKISLFKLFRKFISKKIRTFLR